MKITKYGVVEQFLEPYLKGKCSGCGCEVELSYYEWKSTQVVYIKCPTPLCIRDICLHLVNPSKE